MNNTLDKLFSRVFCGFRAAVVARQSAAAHPAVLRMAWDDLLGQHIGLRLDKTPATPYDPARQLI